MAGGGDGKPGDPGARSARGGSRGPAASKNCRWGLGGWYWVPGARGTRDEDSLCALCARGTERRDPLRALRPGSWRGRAVF